MTKIIITLLSFMLTASAAEIAKSAQETSPIEVGKSLKDTQTFDAAGKPLSMKELLKDKNAVFVFFRGQWCPYCMKHLKTLEVLKKDLKKANAKLYIVSAEDEKKSAKLQKKYKDFTILSDKDGQLMADFGIAFNSGRGILPVPAVYILSKKTKKVVFAFSDKNYRNRLSAEKIAEALKRL